MKILVPENAPDSSRLAFKVGLPDFHHVKMPDIYDLMQRHFPAGFFADYPALYTDFLARDLLNLAKEGKGQVDIFIDIDEFRKINMYVWLPFTIALHCLILLPDCRVYSREWSFVDYSNAIDNWNRKGPMECIRNLCIYLNTPKGERAARLFDLTSSGVYVPFSEEIFPMIISKGTYFSEYYAYWLRNPYRSTSSYLDCGFIDYFNHPYDHLPVRNMTNLLRNNYFTENQWKEKGYKVPELEQAVFLHDQMNTVRLRPYWPSEVVIKR